MVAGFLPMHDDVDRIVTREERDALKRRVDRQDGIISTFMSALAVETLKVMKLTAEINRLNSELEPFRLTGL